MMFRWAALFEVVSMFTTFQLFAKSGIKAVPRVPEPPIIRRCLFYDKTSCLINLTTFIPVRLARVLAFFIFPF